jgi:hypothetical protein
MALPALLPTKMPSSFTILRRVDSGIAIGHLFEVVDQVHVHVLRHEIFTDAFGDVWVDLVLVEDARSPSIS